MARRPDHPKATNFEKLSARTPDQTLKNRDVYESQQLDRSRIDPVRTKTSRTVISLVVSVIVFALVWLTLSAGAFVVSIVGESFGPGSGKTEVSQHYKAVPKDGSKVRYCFKTVDALGEVLPESPCYEYEEEAIANPPAWWTEAQIAKDDPAAEEVRDSGSPSFLAALFGLQWWKVVLSLAIALGTYAGLYAVLMRNLDAQNLMNDTTDVNQYEGDQHVALPDEVMRKFDWFPDVGAHSDVQFSSMISHVMITNKGLKRVEQAQRATQDILDEDGDIEYLKGEILRDDAGDAVTKTVPLIDEAFARDLYEASGLPDVKGEDGKPLRRWIDTTKIPYNPGGKDRDKLGNYSTVADLINADWTYPEYETQRPAGAYLVDTAPVNTMVLAITRAGKGQTYIEPVIDMWLRERNPNNMVINDPKGELLVKNYVRATMRGFQVVQFNLINAMKTDIYNPLGMAADAAREGDTAKMAEYVNNIADVFFPLDGGEDPVWPNAANNAFKRAAYGLIDFYLEEERELRALASRTNMDPKILEKRLDEMWGKVTLYNCYQLFVQLTAKKMKNPIKLVEQRLQSGEFGDPDGDDFDADAWQAEMNVAESRSFLWDDKPELDQLTLFFNATAGLPRNSMRTEVANADNALRAMGAAEKMLASVYGIAITAMSFFADPTIATLTSGTPSQNTDLGGLSFPRRMGVRFGMNYLKRDHLIGAQARWDAFEDSSFTKPLGKEFDHDDIVGREGWARYYFKGKFENNTAYLRLRLQNSQTGMLIRTFYFRFTKDYQTSLNGQYFIADPITNDKIVKNGLLVEVKKDERSGKYVPGHTTYKQMRLTNIAGGNPDKEMGEAQAVISTMVRYSESPKAVFLVTPPHLMKYAKLILILVKQLVDLNFDKSYMTKANQKPLYKTRFMLDELGNLQSEGHGISGFETMLSIGLGQEQQFTIILQTLQQLRDVYGESVDKIVQGNTSNIVFLKSTDDSMIETLSKMSGTRHKVYRDSKTVTKDTERLVKGFNVEGKVSFTMSAKEEPVISYNDLAFISERNSILFRAGDSPVWNRNETILPMSWRLFRDTIVHPGHEYSLQTIPTLSSALDFDVRLNQPDFEKMLSKRMKQAESAARSKEIYQQVYNYADIDIARLDPDVYSDEVMDLVDASLREVIAEETGANPDEVDTDDVPEGFYDEDWEADLDMERAAEEAMRAKAEREKLIYAGNQINRDMLLRGDGQTALHSLDREICEAYQATRAYLEKDTTHFSVGAGGSLRSADGRTLFIDTVDESESLRELNDHAKSEQTGVYAEGEISDLNGYVVTDEFLIFLASLDSWHRLADGEFERAMANIMRDS